MQEQKQDKPQVQNLAPPQDDESVGSGSERSPHREEEVEVEGQGDGLEVDFEEQQGNGEGDGLQYPAPLPLEQHQHPQQQEEQNEQNQQEDYNGQPDQGYEYQDQHGQVVEHQDGSIGSEQQEGEQQEAVEDQGEEGEQQNEQHQPESFQVGPGVHLQEQQPQEREQGEEDPVQRDEEGNLIGPINEADVQQYANREPDQEIEEQMKEGEAEPQEEENQQQKVEQEQEVADDRHRQQQVEHTIQVNTLSNPQQVYQSQPSEQQPPTIQPQPRPASPKIQQIPVIVPVSRVSQTYQPKPIIRTSTQNPHTEVIVPQHKVTEQYKPNPVVREEYKPITVIRTSTMEKQEPKEMRLSSMTEPAIKQEKLEKTTVSAVVVPVPVMVSEQTNTVPQVVPAGPQIQYQILLPNEQQIKGTDLHRMISTAYHERRAINLRYLAKFIHNRNHYYLKHSEVLDDITQCLLSRISKTSNFLTQSSTYFKQSRQIYRSFFHTSQKSPSLQYLLQPTNPKTKSNFTWSQPSTNGMKTLLVATNNLSSRMRSLQYYISTTCIETLQKLIRTYNEDMKKTGRMAMMAKQKFCESQQELIKRVQKLWKKSNKGEKMDLLREEVRIVESMQRSKEFMVKWGAKQLEWWRHCIEVEKGLAEQYKEIMRGYLQATRDLHKIDEQVERCLKYWAEADTASQIQFEYRTHRLLSIISVDFITNSLNLLNNSFGQQLTFPRLELWIQINNEQRITTPKSFLLQSLYIKRFTCEFNNGTSWSKSSLLSTIDQGLLLIQQTQLINQQSPNYTLIKQFKIKNLLNTRKDELTVSINEKVKGIVFDSWNKETVRFGDADQAEEFMFFTENKVEVKSEYIK